jgi:hypothetical protein
MESEVNFEGKSTSKLNGLEDGNETLPVHSSQSISLIFLSTSAGLSTVANHRGKDQKSRRR